MPKYQRTYNENLFQCMRDRNVFAHISYKGKCKQKVVSGKPPEHLYFNSLKRVHYVRGSINC